MPEVVARWPIWYLLLAAYCVYQGFAPAKFYWTNRAALRAAAAQAKTPHDHGRITGYRVRLLTPAICWPALGLGLLTGSLWIRIITAIAFLISARSAYREFAVGFAEGRKASELAAPVEHVQGRVRPARDAFLSAALFIAVAIRLQVKGWKVIGT